MPDSKTPGAGLRRSSYAVQLDSFNPDDLKALAAAGLVLLDAVNVGSLVVSDMVPPPRATRLRDVVEHLYLVQDAIHGGDSQGLPAAVDQLLDIAEGHDIGKLQEVVEAMDASSQEMCSEIYCLAGLSLAALETPHGYGNSDMIAQAFKSIRRRIEYDGAAIMCQAAVVGCEFKSPQETRSAMRRMDAWRAGIERQRDDVPVELPGIDRAVSDGS